MPDALISVIIPVSNYGHFIGQCLDSLLAQTYRPLEILVVDDGSTDDTAAIVQQYQQAHPFIQYFYRNRRPGGPGSIGTVPACNQGLQEARGEFISFLAADDHILPRKFELQLRALQAGPPSLAAVYTSYYFDIETPEHFRHFDHPGDLPWAGLREAMARDGKVRGTAASRDYGDLLLPYCLEYNKIHGGTVLCRKDVLERLGYLNPAYPLAHDYELWLRLMLNGYHFHQVPEPMLVYRIHQANSRRFTANFQEGRQLVRQIAEKYPVEALFPPLQREPSPPLEALAHEILGDIWLQHGFFDLAGAAYHRALAERRGPMLSLKLGLCLLQNGEPAAAHLQQALAAPETAVQAAHGLHLCQPQPAAADMPLARDTALTLQGFPLLEAIQASLETRAYLLPVNKQLGLAVQRYSFAFCPTPIY